MRCHIVAILKRVGRLSVAAAALTLCAATVSWANAPAVEDVQAALAQLQAGIDRAAALASRLRAKGESDPAKIVAINDKGTERLVRFSTFKAPAVLAQRTVFAYVVRGDMGDAAVEDAYQVLLASLGHRFYFVNAATPLALPDDPEPRTTQVLLRLLAETNNCRAMNPLGSLASGEGRLSRSSDMTFLLQTLRTRPARCNANQAVYVLSVLYRNDRFDEPVAAAMIAAAEQTWGTDADKQYRRKLASNYFEFLDTDDLLARVSDDRLSWPVREMALDVLARRLSEAQLLLLVDDVSYPAQLRLALVSYLGGVSVGLKPRNFSVAVNQHLAAHSDVMIRNHFFRQIRIAHRGEPGDSLWDYFEAGIGPGSNTETRNLVLDKLNALSSRIKPAAHERALALALQLSKDPAVTVRFSATQALGRYAFAMRQVPPTLCELRADPESAVRAAADYWLLLARGSALAPNEPQPDPNRCGLLHE